MTHVDVLGLLIAARGGAAVGIERQRSGHAEGPRARFAGVRTFTMIGGLGGTLYTLGLTGPAVVVLAGTAALVVAAYITASRHDVDGTTEGAALVVLTAAFSLALVPTGLRAASWRSPACSCSRNHGSSCGRSSSFSLA